MKKTTYVKRLQAIVSKLDGLAADAYNVHGITDEQKEEAHEMLNDLAVGADDLAARLDAA